MSYHNTTHLTGPALEEAQGKARTQEEQILAYYKECARAGSPRRTPSEVCRFFRDRWPITSVRRAITGLEKSGRLVKTKQKKTGPYGKPEHYWQYKPQPVAGVQQTLF